MKRLIPILLLFVSGFVRAEPINLVCTYDNPTVSWEIKTRKEGPIEVYPLEIDLDKGQVKWRDEFHHDILYVDDKVIHWQRYPAHNGPDSLVSYYFTRARGLLIAIVLGPYSYFPKDITSESYFRCFEPF